MCRLFLRAIESPSEDHDNDGKKAPRPKGRIGDNPRRCKTALISEIVPTWGRPENRVDLVQGIADIFDRLFPNPLYFITPECGK